MFLALFFTKTKNTVCYLQELTNCKCKTFIGSVEEMKGNEARVVIFLHPVDQLKDGMVARVKPQRFSSLVLAQRWKKRLTGSFSNEKMILHTVPYYLAISRSTCEVRYIFASHCQLPSWIFQAYVLNLPIGYKISHVATDTVVLEDCTWKPNKLQQRNWMLTS